MTVPWRRAVAAALVLTAVAGGVLLAGTAQAEAQAVTTGTVSVTARTPDPTAKEQAYSYSTGNGDVMNVYSETGGTVRILVTSASYSLWLAFTPGSPGQSASGQSPVLAPGTYTARLWPDNGTSPGLYVFGAWGCYENEMSNSFTVNKAVFGPQGYVQAFDATFVQHCEKGAFAQVHGEVSISNPPPPPPSPSPTAASPYARPTFQSPAARAGGDAHLARGGAAGGPSTPTPWTDADRGRFIGIGLAVIAVVILVVNLLIVARTRRLRQAHLAREPSPAWPATAGGVMLGPWPTDDPVEHRWLPHDPSPPVARGSMPGKVIAVSVVVAVRGMIGLLVTFALIGALHLSSVQQVSLLPSWYENVLWGQLAIDAAEVVFGLLLLLGKPWPRMLAFSVLWYDIAGGVLIMFATRFSCAGMLGIAIDAVLIWMLFWREVEDWCY
jgi:hypothetical protein